MLPLSSSDGMKCGGGTCSFAVEYHNPLCVHIVPMFQPFTLRCDTF